MDKDRQTTLRLPEWLLARIAVEAKRSERTTSSLIRWVLVSHFGGQDEEPSAPAKRAGERATKRL
jgi:hypothetical protein